MSDLFDPASDIDRVALAIASEDGGPGNPIGYFPSGSPMRDGEWDWYMPEQREAWRRMARAAIAALAQAGTTGQSSRSGRTT